ncbi:MAG: hypothetical protein KUG82_01625 [Pseudomonadales bacterium]|nr:hypothetical protein [Pseudomonadales bacterium]
MASKTPDNRKRIEPTLTLGANEPVAKKANKKVASAEITSKGRSEKKVNSRAALSQAAKLGSGSGPVTGSVSAKTSPLSNEKEAPSANTSGGQGLKNSLFVIVIVLLIGVIGAGGLFFVQQLDGLRSELLSSKDALNVSSSQLGDLETRLSSTDKTIDQAGNKVSGTLAELDSEVRKLWAIANKRNKNAISENKKSTAAMNKALGKVKKSVEAVKKQAIQVQKSSDVQAKTIQSLSSTVKELERQLEVQNSQFITLQQDLVKLSKQSDLSDTVKSNVQALTAIDAYRRQTNASIEQLNQDIRNLFLRTAPPGSVPKAGL